MLHRIIAALVAGLCFTVTVASAEESEITLRVLGLFQEDREEDLREVIEKLPQVSLVSADYETGQGTFRFDAEKVFPGRTTRKKLTEGLDRLVRQECRGTFEVTPATDIAREALERVEIGIDGLDCKGCSFAAYLAVYKIEGVENATASFRKAQVVAWIDPEQTDRRKLVEALEKKGVQLKKQEQDAR